VVKSEEKGRFTIQETTLAHVKRASEEKGITAKWIVFWE